VLESDRVITVVGVAITPAGARAGVPALRGEVAFCVVGLP
jgi:hypothetical protein